MRNAPSWFDWLHGNHDASDSERMRMLVGSVGGRRLSYRPVSGV